MARVNLFDFGDQKNKGLWITGTRERTPKTHMRRNTAIHAIRERELRTRNGSTVDAAVTGVHSLTRFDDIRFQGDGVNLRKAGAIIDSGQDGTPLEFEVSEPRTGTDAEYLFVAGGGSLVKVDSAGVVTNWGIDPPAGSAWNITIGTGEEDDEVTVIDPQEKTFAVTTVTTGWTGTFDVPFRDRQQPTPFIDTDEIPTPSGSAVCMTFAPGLSDDDDVDFV